MQKKAILIGLGLLAATVAIPAQQTSDGQARPTFRLGDRKSVV